ncbi:MAG: flavin reductase family protein [Erysipelotrichaceae bacterium]|nr:flavin reductase family protein [Erysipelotrichaceae bacterium]
MSKVAWRAGNMLYPLPAVMVTTLDQEGKPNILTVAWAGTVCSDPAMVSISVRPSRYSYQALKERGEFVINLVSKDLTGAMDTCGVKSGKNVDKFAECQLHPEASRFVEVPGIAESPVCIECRVKQIIPLGSHDLFIAEVLGVNVEERLMQEDGRFALEKASLVAYNHGEYRALGEKLGSFGYSVRKKKKKKAVKKC